MLLKMTYTREDDSVVWTGFVDTDRPSADEYGREIPPMYVRLYDGKVQAIINGSMFPIIINKKLTLTIEDMTT